MVEGIFTDGVSSKPRKASLSLVEIGGLSLRIYSDSGGADITPVEPSALSISSRLGNSARYIKIKELGEFETHDNDAVDALCAQLNQESSFLHTLESNLSLIIIAIVITVLFSWATINYGVPKAADALVAALPDKTSDILETTIIENVEERFFLPSKLSSDRINQINALFESVAQELKIDSSKYKFKIRKADDEIGANALAFPNGMIIMTDQLITLADSDRQIAGIIAHELGHLEADHSLRQIVRGSLLTFIVAFIAGDASGASAAILSAPTFLAELQYSRKFEIEADDYAIRYFSCDTQGLRDMAKFFMSLGHTHETLIEKNQTEQDQTEQGQTEQSQVKKKQDEEDQTKEGQTQEEQETLNDDGDIDGDVDGKQTGVDSLLSNFLSTHPASDLRAQRFEQHISTNCQ